MTRKATIDSINQSLTKCDTLTLEAIDSAVRGILGDEERKNALQRCLAFFTSLFV